MKRVTDFYIESKGYTLSLTLYKIKGHGPVIEVNSIEKGQSSIDAHRRVHQLTTVSPR